MIHQNLESLRAGSLLHQPNLEKVEYLIPDPMIDRRPGLFTRLRLPIGATPDALLVNERAIAADQSGRYVLVVNDENKSHALLPEIPLYVGSLSLINHAHSNENKHTSVYIA
jgi:hypothetical protein